MPNWCENEVTIGGPTDVMATFLEAAGYAKREFSFQRLRPMPEALEGMFSKDHELWFRTTGQKYDYANCVEVTTAELQELKLAYGCNNPRAWMSRNWGVCYEATSVDYMTDDEWSETRSVTVYFDTAWGPPDMLYEFLLFKYPSLNIDWFYKEPISRFAGWLGEPQ